MRVGHPGWSAIRSHFVAWLFGAPGKKKSPVGWRDFLGQPCAAPNGVPILWVAIKKIKPAERMAAMVREHGSIWCPATKKPRRSGTFCHIVWLANNDFSSPLRLAAKVEAKKVVVVPIHIHVFHANINNSCKGCKARRNPVEINPVLFFRLSGCCMIGCCPKIV
jgi:hypothetical protein